MRRFTRSPRRAMLPLLLGAADAIRSIEAARVHHASRRRGGVAARGARSRANLGGRRSKCNEPTTILRRSLFLTASCSREVSITHEVPGTVTARPTTKPQGGMQQIGDWLQKLGLGQYAKLFAENEIDVSVLRHLTDQDLKEIGIPLGHRRKIFAAIY